MKVRGVIRILKNDGWFVVRTRGSHRQLKHPTKSGLVTVAGHQSKDLSQDTLRSIWKQAGIGDER